VKLNWGSTAWRMAGAIAVTAGLVVTTSGVAQAAVLATYTWGSGSYHPSGDFIPSAGGMHAGTLCKSGGAARYSYTGIAKTSTQSRVGFASYSYPCDGAWHDDPRWNATAAGGTSYYLQWYGQDANFYNGYSAPGSGARATR
jgi:hypothetical protein